MTDTRSAGTYRSTTSTTVMGSLPLDGAYGQTEWTLVEQSASPYLHYLQSDSKPELGAFIIEASHVMRHRQGYFLVTVAEPGGEMTVYPALTVYVDRAAGKLTLEGDVNRWRESGERLLDVIHREMALATA